MKRFRGFLLVGSLCLFAVTGLAQEGSQVEELKLQLERMRAAFEKTQEQQRLQIEALSRQIEEMQPKAAPDPVLQDLERQLAEELAAQPGDATGGSPPVAGVAAAPQPMLSAGSAYLNVGFDLITVAGWSTDSDVSSSLNLGGHDPIQRGFSLRNAELTLEGAVDPYFKGAANTIFLLDRDGETEFELEEAYLLSTALPSNLQIKAGQFFASFGRLNSTHPHAWGFIDQPLILNRVFGPENLRNPGGQVSWLAPTPFYTELFLGVFNGAGGTAFSFRNPGEGAGDPPSLYGRSTVERGVRGLGDLLFVPRVASSFDLTDTQTIVVGASAALGPNSTGLEKRSEVYGMDAYWKWKPEDAMQGFPFMSWQTEALYRRFEAGADPAAVLTAETLRDWGFYSEGLWGFRPRWVAGLRGEFVTGNNSGIDSTSVLRGDRTRVSPNLTWYPSEFSKLRLQYNHDRGQNIGEDHSVWLQLEILLGAHAAHKF